MRDETTTLYRHFDASGALLYVGVSLSSLDRLADHRGSRWHSDIATVTLEHFSNREAALDAECDAIKSENPKYNIARPRQRIHSPTWPRRSSAPAQYSAPVKWSRFSPKGHGRWAA
jgi:hypothetical protein